MPSWVYYLTEHKDTKTQSFFRTQRRRDAEIIFLCVFVSLCSIKMKKGGRCLPKPETFNSTNY